MGCDIHWIIERRDVRGDWHPVDSKARFFEARVDLTKDWDEVWGQAESRLGDRDYDLFAILSRVRVDEDAPDLIGPLMEDGLPEDASDYAAFEYDSDCHSFGWADGRTIVSWRAYKNETLNRWLDTLDEVLSTAPIDEIIPVRREVNGEWGHPDLMGAETGHETLARITLSETLIDWRVDPTAWRVLVYYDN